MYLTRSFYFQSRSLSHRLLRRLFRIIYFIYFIFCNIKNANILSNNNIKICIVEALAFIEIYTQISWKCINYFCININININEILYNDEWFVRYIQWKIKIIKFVISSKKQVFFISLITQQVYFSSNSYHDIFFIEFQFVQIQHFVEIKILFIYSS